MCRFHELWRWRSGHSQVLECVLHVQWLAAKWESGREATGAARANPSTNRQEHHRVGGAVGEAGQTGNGCASSDCGQQCTSATKNRGPVGRCGSRKCSAQGSTSLRSALLVFFVCVCVGRSELRSYLLQRDIYTYWRFSKKCIHFLINKNYFPFMNINFKNYFYKIFFYNYKQLK